MLSARLDRVEAENRALGARIEWLDTELKEERSVRKAVEERLTKAGRGASMISSGQVENEEGNGDGGHSYVKVLTRSGKKVSDKVKQKRGCWTGKK